MRRITGTHVYSYVKCPRLAGLDLHLSRAERRSPHAWEEFAAQRGRDFEDRIIAELRAAGHTVARPEFAERDFAAGAQATRELLRGGAHDFVHQAVLARDNRLGLPDLLRRLPGASELGEHHYEVLDVKTSGQPRSDQVLQVLFYSRLLTELQGRSPTHGALILKDGREERFLLADFAAASREVDARLTALAADPGLERPFLQEGCAGCYHDARCLGELADAGDLSLVQGMTRGARAILESLGVRTIAQLADFHPEGARQRGQLESALVRRLRRGAAACLSGQLARESRPRHESLQQGAIVHGLIDYFADCVLALAVQFPALPGGEVVVRRIEREAETWTVLSELLAEVPETAPLLHFGGQLPKRCAEYALEHEVDPSWSGRFVNLERRLTSAAVFPRAVFGLADLVRFGLGRDPRRAGEALDAARWLTLPDANLRCEAKLRADCDDLAALVAQLLGGSAA